ncbi:hypothetical protein MNBD_GAMMA02-20 [hydrothermal vent metagenome]|uniref:Uncharacterized protein n=1 Tax=hydrothermal vent metagenome TaxID=652676 RepID=A0A3B0W216_9ZZZZ
MRKEVSFTQGSGRTTDQIANDLGIGVWHGQTNLLPRLGQRFNFVKWVVPSNAEPVCMCVWTCFVKG